MKEHGLLSYSEHSVTRLQRLNLTDSQQRDAVTYEPGQIVEFHRMAKGVVRKGVKSDLRAANSGKSFAGRRELSSSERTESRSSCHSTRHGISACSSESRLHSQSATESDSRKMSNTADPSSSITSSGPWSALMKADHIR